MQRPCPDCGAKGIVALEKARCPACGGTGSLPTAAEGRRRVEGAVAGIGAADSEANAAMLAKAVEFLLSSRVGGEFALRGRRNGPKDAAGALREPSLYSNADCICTLCAAGIGRDDPRIAPAIDAVRRYAEGALESKDKTLNVQEVSLALRALVGAGEPPKSPVVTGLVALLCKGQRPGGLRADDLVSDEKGDSYASLYPIETFYLARRRGVRIPSDVWTRALSGATASFGAISKARRKGGWATATDVASSTALVVMAKAGTLGDRLASLEDFRSMPVVQQGLAWLDRYFDVRSEPVLTSGTLARCESDSGYAAYLFAVQRLAQLLTIDVLNGERWHATGARHLREIQFPDGSFEEMGRGRLNGSVRCTTSAVLFLLRATPPVTSQGEAPAEEGR